MSSHWVDPDDGTITELSGETTVSSGSSRHKGGGLTGAYVFAAGVAVGAALMIAVREQPTHAPDTTAPTSTSRASPSLATRAPEPSLEPVALGTPVHLAAGTAMDVEIDGLLVSLSVPEDWEGDYYAPHLLSAGRPQAVSLALTTTSLIGSGCLALDQGTSGTTSGPVATPSGWPPGSEARGPVAFTLDGRPGSYFNFSSPAESCQPNHVWDDIVGDFGPRGPQSRLQLWILNVGGPSLVFGLYTAGDTPRADIDEVRSVVASARVVRIGAPKASLGPADVPAGLIDLPPGETQATDTGGARLVTEYEVQGGGLPFRGSAFLYDDGRLIWFMYHDGRSTGLVEQRLTPLGVAIVAGHDSLADRDPLVLAKWLPASAWADAEMHPYVPAAYGVCLSADDPWAGVTRSLMDVLPSDAADLLRGEPAVVGLPEAFDCRRLVVSDAATLDALLRSAKFEQDVFTNRFVLQYQRDGVSIVFEPVLPDGTIDCTYCG